MGNVQVDFNEGYLNVNINGKCIGSIEYSTNPYHNRHYYLKLQLKNYDIGIAKELFDLISLKLDKPMQIMLSSIEKEIVSFILAAGFCCKRKCYEMEVSTKEYIGEKIEESLLCAVVGDAVYRECCEIMFNRYIITHKGVNPWTGQKEDFFMMLPKVVFYEMFNNKIMNFAFVEDNEIAYVYGTDKIEFITFAQSLITKIFAQNETIMFEADDCDEYALELRKLFVNQSEESFDTYIL